MSKVRKLPVASEASVQVHVLTIPDWLPPTLNELTRGKLRCRMKLEADCKNMVAAYAILCGIPKADGKRTVALRFEHAPGVRRPDVDAYFKATLDALKAYGAIVNDSPDWLKIESPEIERGEKNRTLITIRNS